MWHGTKGDGGPGWISERSVEGVEGEAALFSVTALLCSLESDDLPRPGVIPLRTTHIHCLCSWRGLILLWFLTSALEERGIELPGD